MKEKKSNGEMPVEVRREQIVRLIRNRDFIRVTDLSEQFHVSEVTIRGDLDALTQQHLIHRVRGGAVPRSLSHQEQSTEMSKETTVSEKTVIGRMAASLIARGETLILDAGSTTASIAQAINGRTDLRDAVIFTNALDIAIELECSIPRVTVIVTGGTLTPSRNTLANPLGEVVLEQVNVQTAFLNCNGIDPEGGVTNSNLSEISLKRQMLRAAQRRIVVADGSKVGEVQLAFLCGIAEIDLLITGASADPEIISRLREQGLEIMIAH